MRMAYILVQWIEDPPSWDVLPAKKVANGICSVNNICDIFYGDETSPAKILQMGSRSALLKSLAAMERRQSVQDSLAQECGRGQRRKQPNSRLSSATSSDNEENDETFLPTKPKRKEMAQKISRSILTDYRARQKRFRTVDGAKGDRSSAEPKGPHNLVPERSQDSLPVTCEDTILSELREIKNMLLHLQEEVEMLRTNSADKGFSSNAVCPDAVQEPPETPPDVRQDGLQKETSKVRIGPSTTITGNQYAHIKWGNSKKATRELCIAVFGRQVLASHSVTGKTSNAFREKEAKPQLDPEKLSDIIDYISAKSGLAKQEIRKIIAQKCADEEKLAKRKSSV